MTFARRIVLSFVLAASAVLGNGSAAAQVPPSGRAAKSALVPSAAVTPPNAQTRDALDVGSVVNGALAPGDGVWPESRYYDQYALIGRAGSSVTVDLVSDEFDAVLYLVGSFQLTEDDDGAGACNARIEITFPVDGTYLLRASSYRRNEAGAYTLHVTDRPAPPSEATCDRVGEQPAAPPPPPNANDTCVFVRWMRILTIAAEPGGGVDYPALEARERMACELGLETQSGDPWPNGRTARQFDTWYYPNGQLAFQFGAWHYPNGQLAFQFDAWHYPNGQLAEQFDDWRLPDGTPTSPSALIETAIARLPAERVEELLAAFRDSTGDFQTLVLIVLASEAFR
ncbi:MAG: hypothetical protein ABL963_09625 [Longimicrobiales bacterium]